MEPNEGIRDSNIKIYEWTTVNHFLQLVIKMQDIYLWRASTKQGKAVCPYRNAKMGNQLVG